MRWTGSLLLYRFAEIMSANAQVYCAHNNGHLSILFPRPIPLPPVICPFYIHACLDSKPRRTPTLFAIDDLARMMTQDGFIIENNSPQFGAKIGTTTFKAPAMVRNKQSAFS